LILKTKVIIVTTIVETLETIVFYNCSWNHHFCVSKMTVCISLPSDCYSIFLVYLTLSASISTRVVVLLLTMPLDIAGSTELKFSQVNHALTSFQKERDIFTIPKQMNAAIAVLLNMDVAF